MGIDYRLIRAINTGRCFALVGSGPSNELGFPSWSELAAGVVEGLHSADVGIDEASYAKFLGQNKLPELFRLAERDLGDRAELLRLMESLTVPRRKGSHHLYDYLVRWPFACYLTTNYDDELSERLGAAGKYFTVLRNSRDDLATIREGVTGTVYKIHSDFTEPEDVVVTSEDYRGLRLTGHQYYRDRLQQVFQTFDVLIIGHSLEDPDIGLVLELAKESASAEHPVFMIVANATNGEIDEYFEKYNIIATTYHNAEGERHRGLIRLMSQIDLWVAPEVPDRVPTHRPVGDEEIGRATGLFLYRKLAPSADDAHILDAALSPVVLSALEEHRKLPGISIDEIAALPAVTAIAASAGNRDAVEAALNELDSRSLVKQYDSRYWISESGLSRVAQVRAVRRQVEDQALGQFALTFKEAAESLGAAEVTTELANSARAIIREAVAEVFQRRAMAITNRVIAGQSLAAEDMPEVFRAVNRASGVLEDRAVRAAFLEAGRDLLVTPTAEQQEYLAALSQGYFLEHLLGLDPECAEIRRGLFDDTFWICDSSVLLPLCALGTLDHEFALDLFSRFRARDVTINATSRLMGEVWRHLEWAMSFVERHGVDSIEFMTAALDKDGFRQNLFLDGYIRLSARGDVGSFDDYVNKVCPVGCSKSGLAESLGRFGLNVLYEYDLGDLSELQGKIAAYRQSRGTWKNEFQVIAEAEVLEYSRLVLEGDIPVPGMKIGPPKKSYFISHSRVLDKARRDIDTLISWTPEAVYRLVTSLPGAPIDAALLQQCMLNDYYYAGVSFIDRASYLRFFGPAISQSRLQFEEEKDKYVSAASTVGAEELEADFEATDDLLKPFFSSQMGWRVARIAKYNADAASASATEAKLDAEKRIRDNDEQWREKVKAINAQNIAAKHNAADPKHVRKRARQAKRRKGKK
ncbi:MAG: SIR2 family protein [Coriobacteriia bacterium]|nr:SIR2 family protein [Coriobacteriia bacterium]